MAPTPHIIYLASKSPRRRELLKQIGVHYELLLLREQPRAGFDEPTDIDESPLPDEKPQDYVVRVVDLKAAAAEKVMRTRRLTPRPILAADTTVTLNGEILGKPADARDAARMLQLLSGQTHQVLTAIVVSYGDEVHRALSQNYVTFAKLSEAEIKAYVDSNEPMDKAGAYAVQGGAGKFISKLSGSYSGVMGLPLYETAVALRKCGIAV